MVRYVRRRARPRRRLRVGRRLPRRGMKYRIMRSISNPQPTFTETFIPTPSRIYPNAGQLFTGTIGGLPQYAQYANLYNQYRINWVKVMLVPDFNAVQTDQNAAIYNTFAGANAVGMARITWAIQNTPLANPAAGVPANEAVVLQDNGCKIRPLGAKWSCSFKPVVATTVGTGVGAGAIQATSRGRPFLNFTGVPATETIHYGVQAWITQLVNGAQEVPYNVYYKVNFTLRDPK